MIFTLHTSGQHIRFVHIEITTYAREKWWLCTRRSQIVKAPFELTNQLKAVIQKKGPQWSKLGKTYLDSQNFRELAAEVELRPSKTKR